MVCTNSKLTLPTKIFTGNNSVNNFITCIFDQQKRINEIITNHFNKKTKNNDQSSPDCWICNEKLGDKKERAHCHIPGKYRGAAHK